MTEPKDPPRLLDAASGAAPGLRNALGAAQADVGSVEQVSRLAARLGPLLALPAAPPSAGAPGMGAAAKLGLGALALLVAGGGAWLLSTSQSASPPAPISASPTPPAPAAPAPAAPPLEQAPAAAPESAVAPAPPLPAVPDKPAAPAQLSEAELLEQARSALKADPSRALQRANEHRRRYPGGVLVQEREVIAIQALRQLGRTAEAEQRAEAFSKAFPGSAFQRKLKPAP